MLVCKFGTIVYPSLIIQGCYEVQMDIVLLSKWQHTWQCALLLSIIRQGYAQTLSLATQAKRLRQGPGLLALWCIISSSTVFLIPCSTLAEVCQWVTKRDS